MLTIPAFSALGAGSYTPNIKTGIIPCGADYNGNGLLDKSEECEWSDLYVLVRNLIDFCLFYLAIPLSVISIAVAGWWYLISGIVESKEKAKDILWGVLKGLFFAFAAWLIVHFMVDILVRPEVKATFPTEQARP